MRNLRKQPPSAAVKRKEKKRFGAPSATQMGLILPQGHEGSEYMLSFEIGQREGCFYSRRTDRHTDRRTDTPTTALVYRW